MKEKKIPFIKEQNEQLIKKQTEQVLEAFTNHLKHKKNIMKEEKEVPYTEEQAQQVIKDFNYFIGYSEKLDEQDEEFIEHQFRPKIEYVGRVWKRDNSIFLCTKQDKEGVLYGYGIEDNEWFVREDISASACCCNGVSLNQLTQATPTEWMDALRKYAESVYKIGDKVTCLADGSKDVLKSINCPEVNELDHLNEWWGSSNHIGTLLMRDGVWATIITPAKTEKEIEFNDLTKRMIKLNEDIKNWRKG